SPQPQKIIIAGESEGIPNFIKQLRSLGLTHEIHWICGHGDQFFYDNNEFIGSLEGDRSPASFNPAQWVQDLEVTLHQGHHLSAIDSAAKTVKDDQQNTYGYD